MSSNSVGAGGNPILDDVELQKLLKDLHKVTGSRQFDRWRVSFLKRFESFLGETGVGPATRRYKTFSKKVNVMMDKIRHLHALIEDKSITSERVTVRAQKGLSNSKADMRKVSEEMQTLLPGTVADEESLGYSKFHIASVLVRDGFKEYSALLLADRVLRRLRNNKSFGQCVDKQILEECDYFHSKFMSLVDILADLGLQEVFHKCEEMKDDDVDDNASVVSLFEVDLTKMEADYLRIDPDSPQRKKKKVSYAMIPVLKAPLEEHVEPTMQKDRKRHSTTEIIPEVDRAEELAQAKQPKESKRHSINGIVEVEGYRANGTEPPELYAYTRQQDYYRGNNDWRATMDELVAKRKESRDEVSETKVVPQQSRQNTGAIVPKPTQNATGKELVSRPTSPAKSPRRQNNSPVRAGSVKKMKAPSPRGVEDFLAPPLSPTKSPLRQSKSLSTKNLDAPSPKKGKNPSVPSLSPTKSPVRQSKSLSKKNLLAQSPQKAKDLPAPPLSPTKSPRRQGKSSPTNSVDAPSSKRPKEVPPPPLSPPKSPRRQGKKSVLTEAVESKDHSSPKEGSGELTKVPKSPRKPEGTRLSVVQCQSFRDDDDASSPNKLVRSPSRTVKFKSSGDADESSPTKLIKLVDRLWNTSPKKRGDTPSPPQSSDNDRVVARSLPPPPLSTRPSSFRVIRSSDPGVETTKERSKVRPKSCRDLRPRDSDGDMMKKSKLVRPSSFRGFGSPDLGDDKKKENTTNGVRRNYSSENQETANHQQEKKMPQQAPGRLQGKVAVITSANSGIGQTIAVKLVQEGSLVVLLGAENCDETLEKISACANVEASNKVAFYVKCDTSKEDQVERAIKIATAHFGTRIDVLVNNASSSVFKSIEEASCLDWTRSMQVNILGHAMVTRHCLPYMKKSSKPEAASAGSCIIFQGVISNSSSSCTTCSTTTAAMIQMARSCANDLRKYNIRVSSVGTKAQQETTPNSPRRSVQKVIGNVSQALGGRRSDACPTETPTEIANAVAKLAITYTSTHVSVA